MDIRWSLCDDDVIEVFREDDEDPERYSVKEFIAIHGEDALPEYEHDITLDEDYGDYWQSAINLVNAWADCQHKRKLFANATSKGKRGEVWPVIAKNYNGELWRLKKHVQKTIAFVDETLHIYRYYCRIYRVADVGLNWLKTNLLEDKNYKSIREKCKRRMAANKPPVSLKELVWKNSK